MGYKTAEKSIRDRIDYLTRRQGLIELEMGKYDSASTRYETLRDKVGDLEEEKDLLRAKLKDIEDGKGPAGASRWGGYGL